MFGPELRQWILGLNYIAAVELVRGLAIAEASRLRAPLGSVRITGNVTAADRGRDGLTDLPPDSQSLFPLGPQTWQIKTTRKRFSIDAEVAKAGVLEDLNAGRGYVLVWTKDPPSRAEMEEELRAEVAEINPACPSLLLAIEDLERLARVHPAVVQAQGGPPMLGIPLSKWGVSLRINEFEFQQDAAREGYLATIRLFATDDTQPSHLHVFGDTGVGKSRLLFEALNTDGLLESVFVAQDYDLVDQSRLAALAQSEETHGILIVDDATWDDARRLAGLTDIGEGRIRLLTIGDRPARETAAHFASLDLGPLEEASVRRLIGNVTGLDERDTGLVAELAGGYPRLAVELGEAVVLRTNELSVMELLKSLSISELLRDMLPDTDVRTHVTHLALFDRLGFDGERQGETESVCTVFGLESDAFRRAVDVETGRFVSTAGRYRRVTPKAFALWLARGLLRDDASASNQLLELPDPVFDAFRRQMELLGGDQSTEAPIKEVLSRKADLFRDVASMEPKGARLLYAAAYAVPEEAATIIESLLEHGATDISLLDPDSRRQLVWALSHLLWFESTFAQAANGLLILAREETESYSNNSTGMLQGAFRVYLGGTQVPFEDRLAWLMANASGTEGDARIAVGALSLALDRWETRMGGWQGSRLQPAEWRPQDLESEQHARLQALDAVLHLLDRYQMLEGVVATALAASFRMMAERGLAEPMLRVFGERTWSQAARATLLNGLSGALTYDAEELGADLTARIAVALDSVTGESVDDRLAVVMQARYWDLAETLEEKRTQPKLLVDLAKDLASRPDLLAMASGDSVSDELVQFELLRQIGSRDTDGNHRRLGQDASIARAARVGYVVGQASIDEAWADDVIASWLDSTDLLEAIPSAVHFLPASDERAKLVVKAASMGAPLDEVARLHLGAWIRPLSSEALEELLVVFLREPTSPNWLDSALHMLLFWIDEGANEPRDRLQEIGRRLVDMASTQRGNSMLEYAISSLVPYLHLEDSKVLDMFLESLESRGSPTPSDVDRVKAILRESPAEATRRVVAFVVEHPFMQYSIRDLHVLSLAEETAGAETLGDVLAELPPQLREDALNHLDFRARMPTVLPILLHQRDNGEDFRKAVVSRFLFPGEVVMGSYADYLEGRQALLSTWLEAARGPEMEAWVQEADTALAAWIAKEREREAEETF